MKIKSITLIDPGERRKHSRAYIWEEGVMRSIPARFDLPVKEFRTFLDQALKRRGLTAESVRWSQYAGCDCGCSPGFILSRLTGPGGKVVIRDIHINIV